MAESETIEAAKLAVLRRMSACPEPDCLACQANREAVEELVAVASSGESPGERRKRRDLALAAMMSVFSVLATKVDAPPFEPGAPAPDFSKWVAQLLRLVNARMVRAGAPTAWPQPVNQTVEGITDDHYRDTVGELSAALVQHVDVSLGKPQTGCAICGDWSHVADDCKRNPLLLMAFGAAALQGPVWKCFHCGSVFTDPENAAEHFGSSLENAAACVREQAEILTYRAEQLTTLRSKVAPEVSEELARCASALRGVRTWLTRARS